MLKPEERYTLGKFETCDKAIAPSITIVNEFLLTSYRPGMAAGEMLSQYMTFGEDPFIVSADRECAFSACSATEDYSPSHGIECKTTLLRMRPVPTRFLRKAAYMNGKGFLETPELDALLKEIRETYSTILQDNLVEIVLFGSYARGDAEEYSDVDILIMVDDSAENMKKFDVQLDHVNHELTLKYEILISPLLISFENFVEYREVLPFYMNVEKEGVIIYERTAA